MANDREDAARWFAASRRGVMLHEERADYERWRQEPENASALSELQAVWDMLDVAEEPAPLEVGLPIHHRRQFAAMVGFVSVTAMAMTRVDTGWWNTLDWWSR